MNRPRVHITADNHSTRLRQHLATTLPRFIALPGVVGLTLSGGLSRGYADHLSEVDLTVYLAPEAFTAWREGKSPVAVGITVLDGQLYDIKTVDFDHEQSRQWDEVTLWDASYAEILYDPHHLLHALFAAKLMFAPEPGQAEGLMMGCWWHFELAGEIWIHRGDAVQGHAMLNEAVILLVRAMFVANREYIPHEKWLLHMSRSLAWTPTEWAARLAAAMSTGAITVESVRARQSVIRALWEEVDHYLRQTYYPHLPVHMMQKSTYEHLKYLVEHGEMTVADWQAQVDSGFPNGDPFHPFVGLNHGRISVNREIAFSIPPDAMYAWHYEVLRAVLDGQAAGLHNHAEGRA